MPFKNRADKIAWRHRPEVAAKERAYNRIYRAKPENKARKNLLRRSRSRDLKSAPIGSNAN